MADQKVKIGIETTTDIKPVKQTEDALENLGKKSKKSATDVKGLGKETEQLGKKGNAGAAVLELSRGFEDAQYGIQGVLNNIPGLIIAMGGTAGLAGALSLAAVAGSVLWGQFGKGAKTAKGETEDVKDVIEGMLKVYQSFLDAGKDVRAAATDAAADKLKKDLGGIDNKFTVQVGADGVEAARAAAAANIQLARDKVELAENERDLITSTGDAAIRLAIEREVIIKRILADEEAIAEVGRTAALNKAQAEVDKATGKVAATAGADSSNAAEYNGQKQKVDNLRDEADALTASRIFREDQLTQERDGLLAKIKDIEARTRNGTNDSRAGDRRRASRARVEDINETLAKPTTQNQELNLNAQANIEEGILKEMGDELKASAHAQDDAAKAMTAATLALKNLKGTQAAEKTGKKGVEAAGELGDLHKKAGKAGKETGDKIAEDMTTIIKGLGDKVNDPGIKKTIARVTELTQDGVTPEEQNEVVLLIGSLVKQMTTSHEVAKKAFTDIIAQVNLSIVEQGKIALAITALSKVVANLQQEVSRMPH